MNSGYGLPGLSPFKAWRVEKLRVELFRTRKEMGRAAAKAVAQAMLEIMGKEEVINMIFAAAPSQNEFLESLTGKGGLAWSRVQAFHLDEYIGLSSEAPQRFGNYLKKHIFDKVSMKKVYYLDEEKLDKPEEKCARYASLIEENPIDIACLGIGENGHLAFNDPPVADFADPLRVKCVRLDEVCRQQQVHDGCFPSLDVVPTKAITVTIPAIMNSKYIFCMVPGSTKQQAIKRTLEGPVEILCPASILQRHDQAVLFIDVDAAALLK